MYIHPLYHWPPKSSWKKQRGWGRSWSKFDAYIHFPFCRNICDYCGYETRLLHKDPATELKIHLKNEVAEYQFKDDFANAEVQSIFFGGGTASLLSEDYVGKVIESLDIKPATEITLECEPGTISRSKIREMAQRGVNRISVCAQSLDDKLLKSITRKHSVSDVMRLIDDCVAVGLSNLHIDLMYGLPIQSMEDWERTLRKAVELPMVHLSAYKLFVFRHGALHRGGLPRDTDEDEETTTRLEEMHDLCLLICKESNLEQYTLTEFAVPERRCSYLTGSFGGRDLLPIGPSAFGRNGSELWENSPYLSSYGDSAARDAESRSYTLTKAESFKRQVILGLWLLQCNILNAGMECGVHPSDALVALCESMDRENLVSFCGGTLMLSPGMRFRAGNVMARLASLPTQSWVREEQGCNSNPRGETPAAFEEMEISSIFRTARRDPHFYQILCQSPQDAIEKVANQLSPAGVKALVTAISTPAVDGFVHLVDEPVQRYRRMWLKVIHEHQYVDGLWNKR